MGGAEWLCPFVLIVFFYSNNENSRSRRQNGPAPANVRVLFLQRKKKLDDILVQEWQGYLPRRAGAIVYCILE